MIPLSCSQAAGTGAGAPERVIMLIPCKPNLETGLFEPLLTVPEAYPYLTSPSSISWESRQRLDFRGGKWSAEEEAQLVQHVYAYGKQSWAHIARELNRDFHANAPVRLGKHCRERWFNHLDPDLKSKNYSECEWSPAEDSLLLALHATYGNHWSKIAHGIPGRTENHVKNRWNSLMKKVKIECKGTIDSPRTDDSGSTEEPLPDFIHRPVAIPPLLSPLKLC